MENAVSGEKTPKNKVGVTVGTVFFFLSFLPYFYLIYAGIDGVNFYGYYYGLFAVIVKFFYLSFFGVFPLCIVYQILFGRKYIFKNSSLKKSTLILIGTIVFLIAIINPISDAANEIRKATEPSRIYRYLEQKYGKEMADNANIEFLRADEQLKAVRYYKACSPVLPSNNTFVVSYDPLTGNRYSDNLVSEFLKNHPSYSSDCSKYLCKKNNIPDTEFTAEGTAYSIDFKDYHDGDDYSVLFERTRLDLSKVIIEISDSSDDAIKNAVSLILTNEYLKNQVTCGNFIFVKMYVNGTEIASVDILGSKKPEEIRVRVFYANNSSFTPNYEYVPEIKN